MTPSQLRLATALSLLSLCACGIGYKNAAVETRPEVVTGMGATVMYPGEAGPAMPGSAIGPSGATSSGSSSTFPGTTSGSSSSNGTGVPANGAGAPSAPGGQTTQGGTSNGGAPGSNMTMIGQVEQDQSAKTETKQFLPIGPIFGYPFWFLGKSLEEKADDAKAERQLPKPTTGKAQPHTADDVERDRLMRENETLRQELERRAQPTTQAPAPAPRAAIGDELAALERSLQRRSGNTPPVDSGATSSPVRAPVTGDASLGAPTTVNDRNGDHRPDQWIYTKNGRPVLECLDDDFDGRVDRNLHYDDKGRLVSSEEDLNGDGVMETSSSYQDGKLVRRRTDSDGDGQADTWSFYDGEKLLRTEIDKNGDGFRDVITTYANGAIAREEEDRNGDGRPDVVSIYQNGQLSEKREDMDYDGTPDVVSHYLNGKLVSREANSTDVFEKWEKAGEK
jgi:antitoxin component YwqK of YwqJK toxin-antitoxin module